MRGETRGETRGKQGGARGRENARPVTKPLVAGRATRRHGTGRPPLTLIVSPIT